MPTIATTLIKGIPPVFPPGFCYQNEQQYANALFESASWQFQSDVGNSFFNWGSTLPSPENRQFPWLNSDDGRLYQFNVGGSGKWLSPYDRAPAGPNGIRWDFEDTEAALNLLDGGDAGLLSTFTGPFWSIDHNWDARSSMGAVPTLPVGGQVFTVGTNLGAEQITQQTNQVAPHTHPITKQLIMSFDTPAQKGKSEGNDFKIDGEFVTDENQAAADVKPMTVIHPVRAAYKIRRTIRAWYARG